MKTKAIRLHGTKDLLVEELELPEIGEDEILAKMMTDSVCMSTYKLVQQGSAHKRAPDDLSKKPVIIGHEMAGVIISVGAKWKDNYRAGQRFTIQPSLNYNGTFDTPGYSYSYFGGDCTYCVIPNEVMELNCLIPIRGESFFQSSLAEPIACVIAGYNRMYHTSDVNHEHTMGVKPQGNLIIFGACGPMGLAAIDYALQLENGPALIVAVDVSEERIARAQTVLTVPDNKQLVFFNAASSSDVVQDLRNLSNGAGYDDVFVYAPVQQLIEQADKVLATDGCLNFFAGPVDRGLSAMINMYNIHYAKTHYVGFTGSTNADLLDAIRLSDEGRINPTVMLTHIGGLNSVIETTLNLPKIPGGKKLIYTQIDLPLTAIEDFRRLSAENPLFGELADACDRANGCWSAEAERILLAHYNVDTTK
ncbi:zinc-binding dehydrogenase [Clostridium sp. KNHs216]|uniref:zinc-binding dehydrogenase n=1 Tax=Clostridium sp. KNHs216 TaxID=1550235 RepID=UPI00114D60DA|nr:zinc-binding dehydrogenase [Clostridium sp. KNHs216]TQI68205.1 threonine dehydrogenase-like Zn-dependent dehydrogenase [Clostridium sp. KNHs216]